MSRAAALLLLACSTLSGAATAADKQKLEHVYGPPPSWEEYRHVGEAAIAARMIDPESARITWMSGIHKGEFKPFLEPRIGGYVACGTVNAKNRLGGYTGATAFVVVIDYGRALFADVDRRPGGLYDQTCARAITTGLFPAPPPDASSARDTASSPTVPDPNPSAPLANVTTGLALRAMPDGAYVVAVVPGSPAATAGLKPGMVIASVNAIPLAGMGETMGRVVDAAGNSAALTLVGGNTIKLGSGK
jgi:hypothetical protein